MRRLVCFVATLLFSFGFSENLLFAQFDTGSLGGLVKDASGSVVPGAKITLSDAAIGITVSTSTNEAGTYEFPNLRVGTYKVTAEKAGFSTAAAANVVVSISTRTRVDLNLAVGDVTQTVEVQGSTPLVESDTSQRGQVVNGAAIRELPTNGREYSQIMLLSAGTKFSPIGTGSAVTVLTREGAFNVNGLRSTFNNYLLDGVDNNAYGTSNQGFSNQVMQPTPDSVAEMQTITNNPSAEYGRAAGATVNVALKSGTNALHASLWEFVRNTDLNAVGIFRPRAGTQYPYHRNQFGGTAGGPIVPNRFFFFADYEGFRQIRNIPTYQTIASEWQRQGIFPVNITNPLTGTTYAKGAVIPQSDWQPFARKVIADLPAPTFPTAIDRAPSNNYLVSQGFKNFNDKFDLKFDGNLSNTLNTFVRIGQRKANIFDQPPIPLPSGGAGNGATYVLNQQLTAGLTWIHGANQTYEFRFGASRTQGGKKPASLGSPNASSVYGIPGLPDDPRAVGGLPTELISGYSDLGRQATNPQWQYPTVINPKLNHTHLLGRHSLKMGYEYQYIRTQVMDVNPLNGRDTYAGNFTGNALGDFLFGLRSRYELSTFFVTELRQYMHFAYVQDDFRVTPRLTLNLGLRWEFGSPQWDANNHLTNFDPKTATMLTAKAGSLSERSLVNPDYTDFGPRLGFAYELAPKTVVRGGYGISYTHFNRSGSANLLPINAPQVVFGVVNQTPTTPGFLTTQQGFPTSIADPNSFNPVNTNPTYMPQDDKHTYVQSWQLSVQRELVRNTVLDLAYVGNRGSRVLYMTDLNPAAPNPPGGNLSVSARQNTRPYPGWGSITLSSNGAFSDYNALQAKLERRVSSGLYILNTFTWSKAIDNSSGSLENANGNAIGPQDPHNLRADKSVSMYDQPFTNVTAAVWHLPAGKGEKFLGNASRALNAVIGGWELSGMSNAFSGQPINIIYSPTSAFQVNTITADFRGASFPRVNISGNPVLDQPNRIAHYFNLGNITVPLDPSQPFGNAARNVARSPGFWQFDAALNKTFTLTERAKLQFRAEAFNLFNRANYLAPNSTCSAWTTVASGATPAGTCTTAAFGTITATLDPRLLQLGLKLTF
jgi:hypothetical protein